MLVHSKELPDDTKLSGSLIIRALRLDSGFAVTYKLSGKACVWVCMSCHKLGVGIVSEDSPNSSLPIPRDWWCIKNEERENAELICDVCHEKEPTIQEEPEIMDFSYKEE